MTLFPANAASEFFWNRQSNSLVSNANPAMAMRKMDENRIAGGVKYVTGTVKEAV